MHLQRLALLILIVIPLTCVWSEEAKDVVKASKKLVEKYEKISKMPGKKNIYIIVEGTYYDNIRNIRYHAETANLEVIIGYKNKTVVYYFSPFEIEKLDAW